MTLNGGDSSLKALIELLAALVVVFILVAAVRVGYLVAEGHDDPVLLVAVQALLGAVVVAISAVLIKASR